MVRHIIVLACACVAVLDSSAQAVARAPSSRVVFVSSAVKTYKVTLSKNSESKNRDLFLQARDSSEARKTAKSQNPGWEVLLVSEIK